MYPLLLEAPLKDYLWGGDRLKTEYGFEGTTEKIAEAWVLACRNDGQSVVKNGSLKGKTLLEAINFFGDGCLGANCDRFTYFPLLIKLIDAKQKLSVQVHPEDDYALKTEGEYGKTEMWYVVDAVPGAKLIYGFTGEIGKDEFERRIKDNTLDDVMNYVPVKKGDVFFIPAGTLHAIGEGILIAEVQQNSNTTYRVSDYGRLGADGKPRELHIEKALEVTKRERATVPYGNVGAIKTVGTNTERLLADCDKFISKLVSVNGRYTVSKKDTFVSIIVLSGEAVIAWDGGDFAVKKGDSVFVPAGLECEISGGAQIMFSCV